MNTQLKQWIRAATAAQQEQLAKLAKTSRKVLYHLSGGRNASAAKAIVIEKAARRVRGAVNLPPIDRADLCEACGKCEYARRCREADADMSK